MAVLYDPKNPVIINVSVLSSPAPNQILRRFGVVSEGSTALEAGTYQDLYNDDFATVITDHTSDPYKVALAFFANNPTGSITIIELGEVTEDEGSTVLDKIKALHTFISDGGIGLCYMYKIPDDWINEATLKTELLDQYSAQTSMQYFMINLSRTVSPDENTAYQSIKGSRSLYPVYPTAVETESLAGAMLGVMASYKYNLSENNQMTQLQYKIVTAVTPEELTVSFRNILATQAVNYVGIFTGVSAIFNGVYSETTAWDYNYSFDHFISQVIAFLETALRNGSNVPTARIGYDQDGIDKLLAVINGRGDAGQSFKTITDFSESIDDITGELVNRGTFGAIGFYTYIKNNP